MLKLKLQYFERLFLNYKRRWDSWPQRRSIQSRARDEA